MRNELNHCRGFQRSERENTFKCKIVILRGSEIINREIEICVNTTEKNSQVTVLAFVLLVQIRKEKLSLF